MRIDYITFKKSGKWYASEKVIIKIDMDYFDSIKSDLGKKLSYIYKLLDNEFNKDEYKEFIVVVPLERFNYFYPVIYNLK